MPLSKAQTRHLRALAHSLKPVVMVGEKGVSEALLAELDQALEAHELIKVSIAAERDERRAYTDALCSNSGAELIQIIGRISILYRPAKKPRLQLP